MTSPATAFSTVSFKVLYPLPPSINQYGISGSIVPFTIVPPLSKLYEPEMIISPSESEGRV